MNKETNRPNEHRAWFVDAYVIRFLWQKGWSCCQAEACDWWHDINQHLKKEFFTSEPEWKNFKENGIYPAKHQVNWAKLSANDQTKVQQECWDETKQKWHREQLMAFTLKILKEKEIKDHE